MSFPAVNLFSKCSLSQNMSETIVSTSDILQGTSAAYTLLQQEYSDLHLMMGWFYVYSLLLYLHFSLRGFKVCWKLVPSISSAVLSCSFSVPSFNLHCRGWSQLRHGTLNLFACPEFLRHFFLQLSIIPRLENNQSNHCALCGLPSVPTPENRGYLMK